MQWTASVHTLHMPKPVITFVVKVLRNGLMDCFSTYFTHAQTCDNVRVHSATQRTASVHTLHMPKPVIAFVFKVLRRQWTASVHTLHMSKPVIPCKGTYLDCAYFWDFWPPWTRLHILASILKHVHLIEQWKLLFNNENCKCQDAQKKL